MEPTIYKPSIYKGAGIYKAGAEGGGGGGGGVYPYLLYRCDGNDTRTGWFFGNNEIKTSNVGKCSIKTTMGNYSDCPFINNAKNIYVKYKVKVSDWGTFRLLDTDFENGFRLFTNYMYSDSRMAFYLKKGSTSVYSWETYMYISKNVDYLFEHELDVENQRFKNIVNGSVIIDATVDTSLLDLQRYVPAWGMNANYSTSYLMPGTTFYRDEFSYKIDGVEQIPQETLD